ncbi:MAG: SIR2 family protein [Thermoplasmata archaeon]|nr:SIR2 family protein [Thermoplasmata archaeon]
MATEPAPRLAVLLGAGASSKAGVPTTVQFIEEFKLTLAGKPKLRAAYARLVRRLTQSSQDSQPPKLVDVESVLDALETFRNPSVVDRAVAREGTFDSPSGLENLDAIRHLLQEFMRTKCLVGPERTDYLLPLIQLTNAFRPLPIFTLNYDVVVEQFLESHGVSYVDGFELRFDPDRFKSPSAEVFLYKLHGSVTWFKSQTGGYLKLPIRSSLRQIDLLSGERAEPVMLYPAQKADYAGPFLELFRRFQETLRHAEWLLVLGYSFRDPILVDVILDAAVSNPQLKVVLICGSRTEGVFAQGLGLKVAEVLEYRSQRGTVVKDRMIRLPFRVEDSFSDFVSSIFPALQKATTAHATSIWAELHGEPGRWREAAEEYLRAGAYAQGTTIIDRSVTTDPLQQDQALRQAGFRALDAFAAGDNDAGAKHWGDVCAELRLWVVERVRSWIELSPQRRVTFRANWHILPAGNEGGLDYANAGAQIAELAKLGLMFSRCVGPGDARFTKLMPRCSALLDLAKYLTSQPPMGVAIDAFIQERGTHVPRNVPRLIAEIERDLAFDTPSTPATMEKLRIGLGVAESKYVRSTYFRGVLRPM